MIDCEVGIVKRLALLLIFPLITVLSSCSVLNTLVQFPDRVSNTWQTVTVSGMGAFRVPAEWNVEESDGILYITDKPREENGFMIYLIGVVEGSGSQPHELLEGVERGDLLLSPGFNNGARMYLFEYFVDGEWQERHLLGFDNIRAGEIHFYSLLIWDSEVVDEYITTQIALTYRMNSADFDNPNLGQLAE